MSRKKPGSRVPLYLLGSAAGPRDASLQLSETEGALESVEDADDITAPSSPVKMRTFTSTCGLVPAVSEQVLTEALVSFDTTADADELAIKLIVSFMNDTNINPYLGSVPSERIQNIFRNRHGRLYEVVVRSRNSTWPKYIQKHSDVLHQFFVDGKWRMRLLTH